MNEERREIHDLYVKDSTLRLREMTHADGRVEYKFGQKRSIDPYRREMTTIYLSQREYHSLLTLPGRRLSKTRYPYRAENGVVYEINVFKGEHDGLVIAEIEFETDEALAAATPPPVGWLEITEDVTYDGGSLAR